MEKLVDCFKGKKIAVIGDLILDRFLEGVIERVNPDQTTASLVKIRKSKDVLGGAANVANNILSLGGNPTLYGVLGNDENGKNFSNICKKKKIVFRKVLVNASTLCKQRLIANKYQVARMDFGENNLKKINSKTQDKIFSKLKKDIHKFDAIVLSDYNKMIFTKNLSQKIIDLAKKHKIPTIVDPKPDNILFFKNSTVVCPNKIEAEKITGFKVSNNKLKVFEKIRNLTNSKYLIITCGEEGVVAVGPEEIEILKGETIAKNVRDVTGAGDTFAATLTLGFASQLPFKNILEIANCSAGIVVEKTGTGTTSYKELKEKLKTLYLD